MNRIRKIALGVVTAVSVVGGAGCCSSRSTKDLRAVEGFDAARYMGTWHEIARLPQRFERGYRNVTAHYELKGEKVKIVNRGLVDGVEKSASATGRFAGAKNVGALEVSFFWPFYGSYKVLWVSPDYDCALVTGDSRSDLWILAREPRLSEDRLRELLEKAKAWGYDVEALEYPWSGEVAPTRRVSRMPPSYSGRTGI